MQYTYDYQKIITWIIGLRIDLYKTSKYLYTPRLHIKTEPHKNVVLRFSAGKGYHIPNIFAENLNYFVTSRKWIIEDYKHPLDEAYTIGGSVMYTIKKLLKNNIDITFDIYKTSFLNQLVIDNYSSVHEINIYKLKGKSNTLDYQLNINTFFGSNTELTIICKYSDVKTTYKDTYTRKNINSSI